MNTRRILTLFLLGFIGVLCVLPVIPQLLLLDPKPQPLPLWLIQLISLMQSTLLLAIATGVGAFASKRVGLETPLITAFANGDPVLPILRQKVVPAILGGVIGGGAIVCCAILFEPSLPEEFLTNAKQLTLPVYTRLLYGGITEEVLLRWGMLSLIVWIFHRIFQKKDTLVHPFNFVIAIVLSALLFGLGHLPVVYALTTEVTATLISYIVFVNSIFGLVAGVLYWKKGLETAIGAHMVAHVIMITGEQLIM